jgi:hypothetical protein
MKTHVRKLLPALATLALGILSVPLAHAGCANPVNGAHLAPQSWNGRVGAASNLLLVSDDRPSMVGLWHVAFIAEGNTGPGLPPDGAPVDNALSTWHSDRTEETLSSRPPATGDVCMGVWKEIGDRHYILNHYGIAFDPTVDPNTPLGFANIRQDIILSQDGKTFTGKFTISQYDASGNLLVEIKGNLVGTRVTITTTVQDLLG